MDWFSQRFSNKEMLLRGALLAVIDAFAVVISMAGALYIRCDFSFGAIDPQFLDSLEQYWWINVICTLLIFAICSLYTTLWRFASTVEARNTIIAIILSTIVQIVGMRLLGLPMPRSYPLLYIFLLGVITTLVRFSYRFLRIAKHNIFDMKDIPKVRTMIVGAGAAGFMIVREMKNSKHLRREIPCIIDDDRGKRGTLLHGIPVVGGMRDIPRCAEKYGIEEIVIAIPSLTGDRRRELLEICQQTGCKIKALPGIYQIVNDEVSVSMLRNVEIEELLGRDPVDLKIEEVMDYVHGKTVLVTGGGGSIGSELCRQIAMHEPKKLIIFDIYENNAYEVQNELRKFHPDLDLDVQIGSIRDKERVMSLFETFRPNLVFHAAAHKHVPLMEESTHDAVKNNIFGTRNVALAADRYKAEKMVLISTDKAVRPTNVMGATKRVCEMIIQCMAQRSDTVFAAVRFGNVLGSNGSVIPIFRRQIAEGGPVTVTHPDIIRYFMTIPEAVSLVLQCGAMAKGGEIFLLDMGEPVRIRELAENMIRLSGFKPGEDIKIVYTGLRPGEKLYEELLIDDENIQKTAREGIFAASLPAEDESRLHEQLQRMETLLEDSGSDIRGLLQEIVPEYKIWKNPEDEAND